MRFNMTSLEKFEDFKAMAKSLADIKGFLAFGEVISADIDIHGHCSIHVRESTFKEMFYDHEIAREYWESVDKTKVSVFINNVNIFCLLEGR